MQRRTIKRRGFFRTLTGLAGAVLLPWTIPVRAAKVIPNEFVGRAIVKLSPRHHSMDISLITAYDPATDICKVSPPWDKEPEAGDSFSIS